MTARTAPLSQEMIDALCGHLEALGWEIEWSTDGYIEVWFPDPDTGHAMRFSGWWLSWREVDGQLAFGVGDDTADLKWRKKLALDAPVDDLKAVAVAADRAMHLLWHCDERDNSREIHRENSRLWALEQQMLSLSMRIVVTPGMLRAALKRHGRVRP
ncbi:MAG: hypothetical protein JWO75_484 [Actinomycetia bacterium]|nr:hypothetical protein [Actinomycetes bacterium]